MGWHCTRFIAQVFDLASVDGGAPLEVAPSLLLELPSGHLVRPLAPSGSLLVMHGEATHLWMPPASAAGGVRPYVPAHEVGSVEGLPEGQPWARTWFGRMFFPLADAPPRPGGDAALLLGGANLTFGEYRRRTHQAFRRKAGGGAAEGAVAREAVLGDVELVMAGCSPTRRLLMDEGSCGAGEVRHEHDCRFASGWLGGWPLRPGGLRSSPLLDAPPPAVCQRATHRLKLCCAPP